MIKKRFQKNIAKILCIIIMSSFFVAAFPGGVKAQWVVSDPAHTIVSEEGNIINEYGFADLSFIMGEDASVNTTTAGQTTVINTSTFWSKMMEYKDIFKEYVLDPMFWLIVNGAIKTITAQTVNWINNDFGDSSKPGFLSNPGQFGQDIFDEAAGEFLSGAGLDWLCSPFSLQVRLALNTGSSYRYRPPQCKLSTMIKNASDFVYKNGGVGWDNFFSMTVNPSSNPYGSFLAAQNQLSIKLSGRVNKEVTQLNWGSGFMSLKMCSSYKAPSCLKYKAGSASASPKTSSINKPLAILDTTKSNASNSNKDLAMTASPFDTIQPVDISDNKIAALQLGTTDNKTTTDSPDFRNLGTSYNSQSSNSSNNSNTGLNLGGSAPTQSFSIPGLPDTSSSNPDTYFDPKAYTNSTPNSLQLGNTGQTANSGTPDGLQLSDPNAFAAKKSDSLLDGGMGSSFDSAGFAAKAQQMQDCEQFAPKECEPGHEHIETPGSLVHAGLSKLFNSDLSRLEIADEFNEVLSALAGFLLRKGFSLLGLGQKDASGATRIDYINKILADMDKQKIDKLQGDFNNEMQTIGNMADNAVQLGNQVGDSLKNNNTDSGTNFAEGKTATQSTTEADSVAGLAVDGNTSSLTSGKSVAVTTSENNPWWKVDLGQIYLLNKIKIWRRTGVSSDEALGHFKVTITDQDDKVVWVSNEINAIDLQNNTLSVASTNTGSGDIVANEVSEIPGRYIKIQRVEGTAKKLQLAEVQVYGHAANISTTNKTTDTIRLTKDNSASTAPFEQSASISSNGALSNLNISLGLLKKTQSSAATYYEDAIISSVFNNLAVGVIKTDDKTIVLPQASANTSQMNTYITGNFAMTPSTNYTVTISGQIKGSNAVPVGDYILKTQVRSEFGDILTSIDTPIFITE